MRLRVVFLLSAVVGAIAEAPSARADSARQPALMRHEERVAVHAHDVVAGALAELGDVPVDSSQRLAAEAIVNGTKSGGLVTYPRKLATVEIAMKALEVQGDFVETGVYNGGTAILMGKVLLPHAAAQAGQAARSLWLADSFEGLPKEQEPTHPEQAAPGTALGTSPPPPGQGAVAGSVGQLGGLQATSAFAGGQGNFSFSRQAFDANLQSFGMLGNPRIKVLQGWFKDTLPKAPIQGIAFLRLDGDIFASTMDSITALYDKVVPHGYIYVDDYGSYRGCRDAIDSFRSSHGIRDQMFPIEENQGHYEAVWWRKR